MIYVDPNVQPAAFPVNPAPQGPPDEPIVPRQVATMSSRIDSAPPPGFVKDGPPPGFVREQRPEVGYGEDIAKGLGAGVVEGTAGIIGLPRAIADNGRSIANFIGMGKDTQDWIADSTVGRAFSAAPSAEDVQKGVGYTGYDPQTAVGSGAKHFGTFAPGALLPGAQAGLAGRVVGNVIKPAIGSAVAAKGAELAGAGETGQAIAGAAGSLYGSGLAGAFKPRVAQTQQAAKDVAALEKIAPGISDNLMGGQFSGSRHAQRIDNSVGYVPFTSGAVEKNAEEALRKFNVGLMREAGVDAAQAGGKFDDALVRAANTKTGAEIGARAAQYPVHASAVVPDLRAFKAANDFDQYAWNVLQHGYHKIDDALRQGGGTLSGAEATRLRTELGQFADKYRGANAPTMVRDGFLEMKDILTNAVKGQMSPSELKSFQRLQKEYGLQKDLMRGNLSRGELITPQQLRAAIAQKPASRNQFNAGRHPYQEALLAAENIGLGKNQTANSFLAKGMSGFGAPAAAASMIGGLASPGAVALGGLPGIAANVYARSPKMRQGMIRKHGDPGVMGELARRIAKQGAVGLGGRAALGFENN